VGYVLISVRKRIDVDTESALALDQIEIRTQTKAQVLTVGEINEIIQPLGVALDFNFGPAAAPPPPKPELGYSLVPAKRH
jgi:hypothetical protein